MPDRSSGLKYALLTAIVLVVAVAGFLAFIGYLQLDIGQFAGSGLFVLALVAGTASFFSPCSFPLLVTLLARETGRETASRRPTAQALQFATALAVGVTAFLLVIGGLISAGAGPLMREVTFTSTPGRILRFVVGSLLILLGIMQSRGVRFQAADRIQRPLQRMAARLRRKSPSLGFGLFGFGYVLAGFGWTGPILAGLAGHAFTVGGPLLALQGFVTVALTMSVLMFALALAIALAQESLVARLRANTERVKIWGGRILALVGGMVDRAGNLVRILRTVATGLGGFGPRILVHVTVARSEKVTAPGGTIGQIE